MFDPQQISDRLAVVAGVSLLAAVVVPTAFAVEPMIEGGNDAGFDPAPAAGGAGDSTVLVEASARGFDASAALVLVLIGVAVFAAVLVAHHASDRRGRLATR
jgi:hypothetical protein